jgi:hypothetical protein
MTPRARSWARRAIVTGVLGFAALNALAFMHARALTHFAPAGTALSKSGLRAALLGSTVPKPVNVRMPTDAGMPYESLHAQGARGIRLEIWRIPSQDAARGIVLEFHGHAAAKQELLAAAGEFHRMGWESWLVDFHGSGGSKGDSTSIGWDEAEDVRAAVELARAKPNPGRLLLHGGSMGAVAILRAVAELGVKADALILECPFHNLRTTVAHRLESHGAPTFPMTDLLLLWGGVQQGFNPFSHNPSDYARAVRVPTLVLQGDVDHTIRLSETATIMAGLGDHGRLHVFHGLGHQSFVEVRPAEWRQEVEAFLGKQ